MAKRLDLSTELLSEVSPPQAARNQSAPVAGTVVAPLASRKKPIPTVPLQIRIPASELKAIKRAALESDAKTVSDFMLTCFHAYMQKS